MESLRGATLIYHFDWDLRTPWLSVTSSSPPPKNHLVPLLHKSWDNWNRFYNEIMRNARIIKESGILNYRKVANGGFIK